MENQNQSLPAKGYSREHECTSCHKRYLAKSPTSKYCRECGKEQTKKNIAAYRLRKRLGLVRERAAKAATSAPELCWWCMGWCKPGEKCLDCGTPYDLEKAAKARNRQTASYLDIVARNAKKEGKNPKAELERIRNLRLSGSYGNKQYWQDVDDNLNAYLKTKGYRPMYNGVLVKLRKRPRSRPDREKPR